MPDSTLGKWQELRPLGCENIAEPRVDGRSYFECKVACGLFEDGEPKRSRLTPARGRTSGSSRSASPPRPGRG